MTVSKALIDNGDYLLSSYNLSIRSHQRRSSATLLKAIFILAIYLFSLCQATGYIANGGFVELEHITLFPIFACCSFADVDRTTIPSSG